MRNAAWHLALLCEFIYSKKTLQVKTPQGYTGRGTAKRRNSATHLSKWLEADPDKETIERREFDAKSAWCSERSFSKINLFDS